jgi:luciferase family oxidoreductase group 1
LGLPYAFASHFAPAQFLTALKIYRAQFQPSKYLQEPYMMACVNVIAGDTYEEAEKLATSFYQMALGLVTGMRKPLQPPVESMDDLWTDYEEAAVMQMMHYTFVGDRERLRKDLSAFQSAVQLDEIMVSTFIYDPDARIRSYEILKESSEQAAF